MAGGGFARDMTNSTKSNRTLLKGGNGTYGSFDHASYGHPKDKNEPSYKEASLEILAAIKAQMDQQNAETAKKQRTIIIVATVAAIIGMAVIFFVKF